MAKFAVIGGYTAEAWSKMIDNPGDRVAAVQKVAPAALTLSGRIRCATSALIGAQVCQYCREPTLARHRRMRLQVQQVTTCGGRPALGNHLVKDAAAVRPNPGSEHGPRSSR